VHAGWISAVVAAGCLGHYKPDGESVGTTQGGEMGGQQGGTQMGAPMGTQMGTPAVSARASNRSANAEAMLDPAPGMRPALPAPAAKCTGNPLPLDKKMNPGYTEQAKPVVDDLLKNMSLADKVRQLNGLENNPTNIGSGNPELYLDIERSEHTKELSGKQVRGYQYRDAGRGVNLAAGQPNTRNSSKREKGNFSTTFPCESARAASWDLDLEYAIGEAAGDETMGSLNNMLLAPCMNIIRHPFWGRTQETYSEDMFHTGRMATAMTAGIQSHVIACAKHFAANNVESLRFEQDAKMNEQTLREIYGRHFEMVVQDGGIGCVMASYNSINGVKSTQNKHLLTDVLRDPADKGGFAFRGLVLSDWWAMPGDQYLQDPVVAKDIAKEALKAGLDLELPWPLHYKYFETLISEGSVSVADVNTAAKRILEQKARFNSLYVDDPYGMGTATTKLEGDSIVNNEGHLDLAEEAEVRSAVLLKNGTDAPILPIPSTVKSIAVVGADITMNISPYTEPPPSGPVMHMATDVNVGDRGSSRVNPDPAKSVGPFEGIKRLAATHGITNVTSGNTPAAAKDADFVVVMVGLTAADEGEEYTFDAKGDRFTYSLPYNQNEFVQQVLDLGKPTVIVVQSGSVVALPWLSSAKQATVWSGYGGQRVGLALGKLLFGDRNFSGKMPMAWPKTEADMPPFKTSEKSTNMDYLFGYRYYDKQNTVLEFPFGHGLSYSKFKYSNIGAPCTAASAALDTVIPVTIDVENDSDVDGEEVTLLFVKGPPPAANTTGERPVKELKGFHKAKLAKKGSAGSVKRITIPLVVNDLRHWEGGATGQWVIDEGEYTIMVGPSGDNAVLAQQSVKITISK
jgi:beta-glucosidase